MDLASYVADGIGEIFRELAEEIGEVELSEEEAAGIPMALFRAELFLKMCWAWYVEGIVPEFSRKAVCPDCGAVIPDDGCCWYCENQPEGLLTDIGD